MARKRAARRRAYLDPIDISSPTWSCPHGGRELAKKLPSPFVPESAFFISLDTPEDAVIAEAHTLAATAFLQKPFTLQNLAKKLARSTRSNRSGGSRPNQSPNPPPLMDQTCLGSFLLRTRLYFKPESTGTRTRGQHSINPPCLAITYFFRIR